MEGNVKKALKVYISFYSFFGRGGEVRRVGVSFIIMLYRREAVLNKHCFHPELKRAFHWPGPTNKRYFFFLPKSIFKNESFSFSHSTLFNLSLKFWGVSPTKPRVWGHGCNYSFVCTIHVAHTCKNHFLLSLHLRCNLQVDVCNLYSLAWCHFPEFQSCDVLFWFCIFESLVIIMHLLILCLFIYMYGTDVITSDFYFFIVFSYI